MSKNVTLRLDEAILKKARHLAVEEEKSLSQWVVDLIAQAVARNDERGFRSRAPRKTASTSQRQRAPGPQRSTPMR